MRPFSAIGVTECSVLRSSLGLANIKSYDAVTISVVHYEYWKYGYGNHASDKWRIIGSVIIVCRSDLNRPGEIRHLVLEGSSQWLLGRNVTRACNNLHTNDNRFQFPSSNGIMDYLSLYDSEKHSYVLLDRFITVSHASSMSSSSVVVLTGHTMSTRKPPSGNIPRPMSKLTRIVNRVN